MMNPQSSPLDRQHPVWICAMRPFFLLALVCAIPLLLWWGGVLAWGWPAPAVAGGAIVWHAHELVLGFAVAGVAGFALTALPEFTGVACGTCRQLRVLVGLWLLVRLGFWVSGWLGLPALALAGASQLALLLGVAWVLLPALKTATGRRHWAFAWLVLALAVTSAGFYSDVLRGLPGLRWLDATVGVLMLLIVVAASRISMRIVNNAIEEITPGADPYLARPPRRTLAALCIGFYTVAEFVAPWQPVTGWLGLAAAAAMLNLLNDWHVGRPLWKKRFPALLYAMYWCMALGYGALGAAQLGWLDGGSSAGRHFLTMGAIGLGMFIVLSIAGRAHVGRPSDPGPWLGLGGAVLLAATVWRAAAAVLGSNGLGLAVAAALWCIAFALLAWRVAPGLWLARTDGKQGCAD
ncbi:NnrS family protein [Comamonas nitrativorans]|uniref:NnrS family protein n=1 Tax=Comamonas nitrativorans TaxID=108437 RepID=A0ABV9GRM4_9BURK